MSYIPPPPTTTPPSVHPTSYRSVRESELDAIRRRGLTKIFNKHFTSVTETISRERQVAEAALAEIERRKADLAVNPKEFQSQGDWNLTHLDKLYLELSRRKIEVQKRERETQELYRRYVAQYGVRDGLAMLKNNTPLKYSYSGGGGLIPITCDSISDDVIHQADLLMLRIAERTAADANTPCVVESMTRQIEEKIKAIHSPAAIISSYERPLESTSENEVGNESLSPSDSKNVQFLEPCIAGLSNHYTALAVFTIDTPHGINVPNTPAATSVSFNLSYDKKDTPSMSSNVQLEDEFDTDSTLSALTEIDGVTIAEAEWRLTEFLRIETESIRKMLISELPSPYNHTEENEDSKTVYSIDSRRSMEATLAAERMARCMVDATAWMNDPSKLVDEDVDEANKVKETTRVNYEWHAYWSTEHNREYYYNSITNQTCWSRPKYVLVDTSNLTQEQSVTYADDEFMAEVKDYSKTGTRTSETKKIDAMSENNEMIDLYKPDSTGISDSNTIMSGGSLSSKRSKLSEYRHQILLRKRRKQRLILVTFCCILGLVLIRYTQKLRDQQRILDKKLVDSERILVASEAEISRLREEELKILNELDHLEWIKRVVQDVNFTETAVTEKGRTFYVDERNIVINGLQGESQYESMEFILDTYEERVLTLETSGNPKCTNDWRVSSEDTSRGESHEIIPLDVPASSDSWRENEANSLNVEGVLNVTQYVYTSRDIIPVDALAVSDFRREDDVHILNIERIPNKTQNGNVQLDNKANESSAIATLAGVIVNNGNSFVATIEKDDHVGLLCTPVGCRFPFAYIFSAKCRLLAEKKPWFDLRLLVDNMLQ